MQDLLDQARLGFVVGAPLADGIEEAVDRPCQPVLDRHVADPALAVQLLQILDLLSIEIEPLVVGEDRVALDSAGNVRAYSLRVCVHPAHLAVDRGRVVGEVDDVVQRFARLGPPVRAHEQLPDQGLGFREDLAVQPVEPAGDLPRDFHVGLVVLGHGHQVGAR